MSAGVMEEAAHWGPLLEEPRFVHRTLPAGGSTFRRHSSAPLPSSPLPDSTQRRPAQGRAAYLSGHAAPSALCASCPRSCPVSCSPSLSRLESVGHPPSTGTLALLRPAVHPSSPSDQGSCNRGMNHPLRSINSSTGKCSPGLPVAWELLNWSGGCRAPLLPR